MRQPFVFFMLRPMTRFPLWVIGGVVVAVGACGGGSSTPTVASAPGARLPAQVAASPAQRVHVAAQCVRDHGVPNFPDPVIDTHGDLQVDQQLLDSLPASVVQTVKGACTPQINAAESAVNAAQPGATPQEIAQATRLAQCMRQHGWPNFPDPDAHGGFSSASPGQVPTSKSDPAFQACRAVVAAHAG